MDSKTISGKFSEFFHVITNQITIWLNDVLSNIDDSWWQTLVVSNLSYPQRQRVERENITRLDQLDLAALVRIMDKNWYQISSAKKLTMHERHYVKDMMNIRNRWSHENTQGFESDEIYRDIDSLQIFLSIINGSEIVINDIKQFKKIFISDRYTDQSSPEKIKKYEEINTEKKKSKTDGKIITGSIVALNSDPSKQGAVVEVGGNLSNSRCDVFIDGKLQPFYLSQLHIVEYKSERQVVSISDLHILLTCLQIRHPSLSTLYSLNAARIDFVPYQFRPALKIIASDQPRLLIADGVGVGKTIEAGLVLRELQARNDIESVLIICPKPLITERKWELEMKRFDERFTHLDGNALRYCLSETDLEGEWPDQHKKTIIPYSLFDERLLHGNNNTKRSQVGLSDLNPPPRFDLVIVDEAHHIRNSSTFAHQAVRMFCENAEAVLFISATPVQLGNRDLYTLLHLLRPDLVIDEEAFSHMAEPNPFVNQALRALRSGGEDWSQIASTALEDAANTAWGSTILQQNPEFLRTQEKLRKANISREDRVSIIRKVEGYHSFSRLINRTRRRDIDNFCIRRPFSIEIEFNKEQRELHDELLSFEATALSMLHGNQNVMFMMSTIRRQAASCIFGLVPYLDHILNRRISELELLEITDEEIPDIDISMFESLRETASVIIEYGSNLPVDDPKFDEFFKVINEKQNQKNNKVMVFSSFKHTLFYLEEKLKDHNVRVGLIYGDVKDEDRLILRRRFEGHRDLPDSIDVMLFSEVGCEGLDYQFCDMMINYDLPWNPMRIEQRIGRIDRRGQKSEAVAIYNLIVPGTVDAEIYNRCLSRIGIFEESIGDCEEILGDIHRKIRNIASNVELSKNERQQKLEQLADNEIRKIQEQRVLEDREYELFGIQLPKINSDDEILESESYWLTPSSIKRFVSRYLNKRLQKGEFILGEKALQTLRISQNDRNKILEDYRKLKIQKTPMNRTWERWLKGGDQHCSITFDSECASNHRDSHFIMPLHPLVRQAAEFFDTAEPVYTAFRINDSELETGNYLFAIYAWEYKGIRQELKLVPICENFELGKGFFDYLETGAVVVETENLLPNDAEFKKLDDIHHGQWNDEKEAHANRTIEICSFRRESLETSHQGRVSIISDQLANATDERIRRMKQAQLNNNQADYERKKTELDKADKASDILARPVVFGMLIVGG